MPPEVSTSHHFRTPQIFSSTLSRSSESHKHSHLRKMDITCTRKRLIHMLVFILACMSILRLLRFAISTYSSSPNTAWPYLLKSCNSSDSTCTEVSSYMRDSYFSPSLRPITKKEYRFLSNIISQRAPCSLLIFGWEPQYRRLAKINAGGTTVFLEDNLERMKIMRKSNSTQIYKVNYDIPAKEAYQLLKHAREETVCSPNLGSLETSTCKLALKNLPKVVYRQKWDVILVDGPSSDGPEAPGRMAAIYTSSMIARAGNITTNVVVHDINRMIERWFSWEFLCEENLVSSKGRYWNFRIKGDKQSNTTSFCSQGSPSKE